MAPAAYDSTMARFRAPGRLPHPVPIDWKWVPWAPALALLLLASGCVHALPAVEGPDGPMQPSREAPPLVRVGEPVGLQLADRATRLVDHDGSLLRRDCSGLIETLFLQQGLALPTAEVAGNAVAREFEGFKREGALVQQHPLPGDLAFFDDTYDRNHNGRLDDPLTHVALVTEVDLEGTLTLVHFGSHGVTSFRMNLAQLHAPRDGRGRRINDRLRVQTRRDPPRTHYLASELFVAFGRAAEPTPALANR